MSNLSKQMSDRDSDQVIELVYNEVDKTISTNGFLSSKVGNRIVRTAPSSTTEQYDFYDGSNLLYSLLLTYTDSTLATLSSAERTA